MSMTKTIQDRFRGLHSWYDPKTDTYFVYVYDKITKNVKASLKITGDKIQVISGKLQQ